MAQRAKIEKYTDGATETVVISNLRNNLGVPVLGLNETFSATMVDKYWDGTDMTDAKVDGKLYIKLKKLPAGSDESMQQYVGKYFKVNLPNSDEIFLEKSTMAQMKAISGVQMTLLRMGYYKGVRLRGYWTKYDTARVVDYYISTTTNPDDGGSVVDVGSIKLEASFVGDVNVKYFGARGDNSANDTAYIEKALLYLDKGNTSITKGSSVFVPKGTYKVTPDRLELKDHYKIYGEGKSSLIISDTPPSVSGTKKGITIKGNSTIVSDLYIRGFDYGVHLGQYQRNTIERCVLAFNRIGIWTEEAYINSIRKNYITDNQQCGVVIKGQSFELVVTENVIDNNMGNTGGCGILLIGPGSPVISDNTIEGNRNLSSGHGVGIYVLGTNARTVIQNNWFEANCNPVYTDLYASDIYFHSLVSTAMQAALLADCVPDEFKGQTTNGANGNYIITGNMHSFTKNGIVMGSGFGKYYITDEVFNGTLGRNNRAIYMPWTGLTSGATVNISNYTLANYDSNAAALNAEMNAGIGNTPIFLDNPTSGNFVLSINDAPTSRVRTFTASGSIASTDRFILGDTTAASIAITLPPPSFNTGKMFTISKIATTNTLTLFPNAGTIDGNANIIITGSVTVVSTGSGWKVVSNTNNATPTIKGVVNQSAALANISTADLTNISTADVSPVSTADATDAATTQALVNELKAKVNSVIALENELKAKINLANTLINAVKASQNTQLTNHRTAGIQAP